MTLCELLLIEIRVFYAYVICEENNRLSLSLSLAKQPRQGLASAGFTVSVVVVHDRNLASARSPDSDTQNAISCGRIVLLVKFMKVIPPPLLN